ncbi:MAG TPA: hypothetical protein VMU75_00105 [Acidimicrobiales bacterium]|nr:hypothetical protein [Acidimicrobiales bacterium]
MDRSPEVERLVIQLMGRMKAGDAAGVEELFAPGAPTLLVGNGPDGWYWGSDATVTHLRVALEAYGGVPFEPPTGCAASPRFQLGRAFSVCAHELHGVHDLSDLSQLVVRSLSLSGAHHRRAAQTRAMLAKRA